MEDMKILDESDTELTERLFKDIQASTQSKNCAGVTRSSYGAGETRALSIIQGAAREYGLDANIDLAGNLVMSATDMTRDRKFGEAYEETWDKEASIFVGSHLDSVPQGGNYDGLAGVIAALLVLRKANERGVGDRIVGLGLRGEESAWFGISCIGSKAILGKITETDLQRKKIGEDSVNSQTLHQAMGYIGADMHAIQEGRQLMPFRPNRLEDAAFWELHIEQGPILVDLGIPVGVVDSIRGNLRTPSACIRGEAGHSGTTPHALRKDAVLQFAQMLTYADRARDRLSRTAGKDIVLTCGIAGTTPGEHAMTKIADVFRFSLDIRSVDDETAQEMMDIVRLRSRQLGRC